ncbi:MAG: putative Subtilisin [Deltaproteobacteria bacterium]|nr:putative Subtilisin [Deltaproteobacteria bacterium]
MIFKKWGKLFSLAYFLGIICSPMIFPAGAGAIEIDPELEELFVSNEAAGYAIYFRAKANLSEAPKTGWKEQSEFVSKALQDTANQSQARVRSYLFGRRVSYRSLWKENVIVVDRSDRDTFEGLKSFSEIESIKGLKMEAKSPRKVDPAETKDDISTTKK